MLYTRKGDNGTTKTFSGTSRISKSSAIAEALGACDEANSFIGLLKVGFSKTDFSLHEEKLEAILHWVQEGLFIVQAELAGASMSIPEERVKQVEKYTDDIEHILPPITTFFISGGTELAALADVSRTLIRKAERRIVAVHESGVVALQAETLAFVNRLSSLLYAVARLSNHFSGINEQPPQYK